MLTWSLQFIDKSGLVHLLANICFLFVKFFKPKVFLLEFFKYSNYLK